MPTVKAMPLESMKPNSDGVPVRSVNYLPSSSLKRALPYLLAAFAGIAAMRNATTGNVVGTDAARHAMNGAMIHDYVLSGNIESPIEFAKRYYAKAPALSLPFYPPLFHTLEAAFFSVTGVNSFSARLLVALTASLCAVLLYKLVLSLHGSHLLAGATTVIFFGLKESQLVSTDVMLEFPCMVFVLASLYQLRDLNREFPMRRALAFAILAGAAVWTKQNAVFLGAVPFVLIVFLRKWQLLREKPVWIASVVFGLLCIGMIKLTSWAVFGGYAGQFPTTASSIASVMTRNGSFYMEVFIRVFGVPGTAIIAASTVFLVVDLVVRRPASPGVSFHLAWMLTGFALCAAAHRYSDRYLFFVLPAPILIGFLGTMRLVQATLPARRYGFVLSIAMPFAAFAHHFQSDACFLSGPADVAQLVSKTSPKRILYCGWTDGTFIFALRSMNSEATVIRGDKLPKESFSPDELEVFVREFGIDYVVIESTPMNETSHLPDDHDHQDATVLVPSMFPNLPWRPWYDLPLSASVANMNLVAEISQVCHPFTNVNGTLYVYRNRNKATTPKSRLEIWAPRIRGNLILELP